MSKHWLAGLALLGGLGLTGMSGPPPRQTASELAPTRLEVDLSEREMYLYHDDRIVNTYSVAVGEAEYPTPQGDFSISRIEWNPNWVPPDTEWGRKEEKKAPGDPDNPMQGAKLFFQYPDYYIHGTDATHTLGDAESHGCLRMDPERVLDLAKWVQEHAGETRSESWFREVRKDDDSSHTVTLSREIPITIHE